MKLEGRHRLWLLALVCALVCGCASAPRPPAEFRLDRAVLVRDPVEPRLVLDGPSGKGSAAGRGAAKGAGTGLLVGASACAATGPFIGLCLLAVVPTSTVLGAGVWATASAMHAESAEAIDIKRELLRTQLARTDYAAQLLATLQGAARERSAGQPAPQASAAWVIDVALTAVAGESEGHEKPFALRVEGRLTVRPVGQDQALFLMTQDAVTEQSLTSAQWAEDDAIAVRRGLDQALRSLGERLLDGLLNGPNNGPNNGQKPSTPRSTSPTMPARTGA